MAQILKDYLASEFDAERFVNDLNVWGGSGSIMDQALINQGREVRRKLEDKAIYIGAALQDIEISSPLVGRWMSVFQQWKESGV